MSDCLIKTPIYTRVETSGNTGLDFSLQDCIIPEKVNCFLCLEEDRNNALLQEDGFILYINCIDSPNEID